MQQTTREPVRWTGHVMTAVRSLALIALGSGWLDLTPETLDQILVAGGILLGVVDGLLTERVRNRVSPV